MDWHLIDLILKSIVAVASLVAFGCALGLFINMRKQSRIDADYRAGMREIYANHQKRIREIHENCRKEIERINTN